MRVQAQIDISAPAEMVWDHLTDPARALHFMSGVTRWEVCSPEPRGLGARYRMLMRVGSAEMGGLVEVVEYNAPYDMAWTSVTGLDQRGRWRLRERRIPGGVADAERTHVEFRLSYGVAGSGIFGLIAERFAAPTVRGHLRRSLLQLKRQVEHEQLRVAAAERKRTKASAA
jgi:uncharacterized membrane protein